MRLPWRRSKGHRVDAEVQGVAHVRARIRRDRVGRQVVEEKDIPFSADAVVGWPREDSRRLRAVGQPQGAELVEALQAVRAKMGRERRMRAREGHELATIRIRHVSKQDAAQDAEVVNGPEMALLGIVTRC